MRSAWSHWRLFSYSDTSDSRTVPDCSRLMGEARIPSLRCVRCREIHLIEVHVFPVHKFLKMIADEFLHLHLRHVCLEILDFRPFRRCAHPGSLPPRGRRL